MPASHDYAERLRARLPRTLQEEREAAGLSRYALEKKCGVSREMIGCIESGDSIPTLHLGARNRDDLKHVAALVRVRADRPPWKAPAFTRTRLRD